MNLEPIEVTTAMRERARGEAGRREPHINHRFLPADGAKGINEASFIGEFCFRVMLGRSWQEGIREDYRVPDLYDELVQGLRCDVKTDRRHAADVLFNAGQAADLIEKYDLVFFGSLDGGLWWPRGWLPASAVRDYPVVEQTYSPAHLIPVSTLRKGQFLAQAEAGPVERPCERCGQECAPHEQTADGKRYSHTVCPP